MNSMARLLRQSLTMLVLLSIVTGALYPLAITGLSALLFPMQARGSVIEHDGKATGSALIGQGFTALKYFWGRPSATAPIPYSTVPSGASNQGPNNPALADAVKQRVEALRAADPGNIATIPVDLITASASGLDPHITPAAARYQLARVARERGLEPGKIQPLIDQATEGRQLGVLGEPRVNVLKLNLMLDGRW